jgi:DNA repair protein RecO
LSCTGITGQHMAEAIKCKGIILKNHRLSDSDKIVHIISNNYGPLKAVAKGAYKIKSKHGPKTQVLQFCEFLLAKGRNLDIIQEIRLIDQFQNIQKDFDILSTAYFFCEIIDSVTLSGDQDSFDYLNLLLKNLDILNQKEKISSTEQKELIVNFLWQVTCSQGYKPQLNICFQTRKKRNSNQIPQYFDFENGSILSETAYLDYLKENPYEDNIHIFKPGVFKVLDDLDSNNALASEHQEFYDSSIKFMQKHLEFCLHKEFKTWKTLEPLLASTS